MVVYLHSPALEKFQYPPENPFKTERARMTRDILTSMDMFEGSNRKEVAPVAATLEEITKLHTPRYIEVLRAAENGVLDVEGLRMGLGTAECPVFKGMVDYAMLAAGASLTGARLLLSGEAQIAFNPSGGYHHADPEHANGFCYINDVALACQHLAENGKRVLFLDIDAHHGDGVERAFYSRSDVLTLSFHESGETLFPGTGKVTDIGEGEGLGYCVNVPLPAQTYDDAYLRAFKEIAIPVISTYDPDVIVLELGMDSLSGDPLTHLELTNRSYAEMTDIVMQFGKPILATGGGGYNPKITARGWALMWCVLCGEDGHESMSWGMGGVMLETTDWLGGLKDRYVPVDERVRQLIDPKVDEIIKQVKKHSFPLLGMASLV